MSVHLCVPTVANGGTVPLPRFVTTTATRLSMWQSGDFRWSWLHAGLRVCFHRKPTTLYCPRCEQHTSFLEHTRFKQALPEREKNIWRYRAGYRHQSNILYYHTASCIPSIVRLRSYLPRTFQRGCSMQFICRDGKIYSIADFIFGLLCEL